MRKKTKKLFYILSATSIASFVPTSIILLKDFNLESKINLNNINEISYTEENFVNEDSTINIKKTIDVYRTSNVFEAYPKGNISFSNENREIFAFNEEGEILWYHQTPEDYDVTTIEYNPNNDDLIVLLSSRLYIKNPATNSFKLQMRIYNNISEKTGKITYNSAQNLENLGTNSYTASWAMVPVYEKNGSIKKYYIYGKHYYGYIRRDYPLFYEIDINNNYSFKKSSIDFSNNYIFGEMQIYSISAFVTNDGTINMIIPYVSQLYNTDTNLENVKIAYFRNGKLSQVIETSLTSNIISFQFETFNDYMRTRVSDALISDSGFVYNNNENRLNLFFLLNFKSEKNDSSSVFSDSTLLNIPIEFSSTGEIIGIGQYVSYPFWSSNSDIKRLVSSAFFDNNKLMIDGWSNYNSTLYVNGYSNNVSDSKSKRIAIIKLDKLNLTRENSNSIYNSDLYIDEATKNSSKMKLFFMEKNKIINYSSNLYSDNVKINSQENGDPNENWYNMRYILDAGILSNKYDINETDPFNKEIIYTKPGLSKISIFNPGSEKNNEFATYGYKTEYVGHISSTTNPFQWGDNTSISKINLETIKWYLEIDKGINSKFLSQLNIKNLPSEYNFELLDFELFSSKNDGFLDIVKVSLFSNFVYDSNGLIKRTNSISNLNENEKNQYKILDLYISGFGAIKSYPNELKVLDQWINDFIQSIPVTGNTKYIEISEEKENILKRKIIENNEEINSISIPNPIIEYSLDGNSNWKEREEFKNYLISINENLNSNKIYFRLKIDSPLDQNNNPYYSINNEPKILYENNNTHIKYFINEDYESIAESVFVFGSFNQLQYNYGDLPINNNGEWIGVNGITIQWTKDKNAKYEDSINDSKWSNSEIKSIINESNKYLAIRIIAKDNYEYSAQYNNSAKIHILNLDKIETSFEVNLKSLEENLVFEGLSNQIDLIKLQESENKIINSYNEDWIKNNLEIKYKIQINGKYTTNNWIYSNQINDTLEKYHNDFSNSSRGIIQFIDNNENLKGEAKIFATFTSKNNSYLPYDPSGLNIKNGIETNTSNLKTKIDLSVWTDVLKENKTTVNQINTSKISIYPPGMGVLDNQKNFLSNMTFSEIENLLSNFGITIEFQAPGSSNQDNWVSKDEIQDLDNANRLYLRFSLKESIWSQKIELIINNKLQDNQSPEVIKLNVDLPIKIEANIDLLSSLYLEGNTKTISNIEWLKNQEDQIIKKIKNDNKKYDEETNSLIDNANIIIQYSLDKYRLDIGSEEEIWLSLDDLNNILLNSKTNYNSNRVYARIIIKNSESSKTNFALTIPEGTIKEINQEDFSNEAKFKIYINETEYTNKEWIQENLILIGNREKYEIKNLDQLLNALPKGLTIEFNSKEKIDENGNIIPDENGWSEEYNKNSIQNNKYWIRFKPKNGYVFEGSNNTNNPSNAIELKLEIDIILSNNNTTKKSISFSLLGVGFLAAVVGVVIMIRKIFKK